MVNKPIRILQLVSSANPSSGVRSVVLNWHKHTDTSKVQFDYLYVQMDTIAPQDDILSLGAEFYVLPNPYRSPFKFIKEAYKFFKTHRYKTIHSHFTNLNFFFFPLAKLFGTKNIIQHAHLTTWSDKKLSAVRNYLMLHAVWPFITHKIGCSKAAGKAYFGKDFMLVNNAVDIEKFDFNPAVSTAKRKELGIENNFTIANIGRLNVQKNHKFLLEIFAELVKKDDTAKLILVGDGPLKDEIKAFAAYKKLNDKVMFLGIRKDVPELLQAFDVLCMPSLYEGLPVVGVEAQGTGLPCVFSDTITNEVLLLPDTKMLSLDDSAEKWADTLLALKNKKRYSGKQFLKEKGFDINDIAKTMQDFYIKTEKDEQYK